MSRADRAGRISRADTTKQTGPDVSRGPIGEPGRQVWSAPRGLPTEVQAPLDQADRAEQTEPGPAADAVSRADTAGLDRPSRADTRADVGAMWSRAVVETAGVRPRAEQTDETLGPMW